MGQPNTGTAEPWKGDSAEICYSESPWFNADEIPTDKWNGFLVQIEEVRARRGVKFKSGNAKERELFLKFAGIEKELRVNVTIRRTLDAMISPSCEKWWGKWITLFVQGGIDTAEGKKNGVRVRPFLPEPPASAKQPAKPAGQKAGPADETAVMRADLARLLKDGGAADIKRVAAALSIDLKGRDTNTITPDETLRIWTHTVGGKPLPAADAAKFD